MNHGPGQPSVEELAPPCAHEDEQERQQPRTVLGTPEGSTAWLGTETPK